MKTPLTLLPVPRSLVFLKSKYVLPEERLIVLDSPRPAGLRFAASRLQVALKGHQSLDWTLSASTVVPPSKVGITLRVLPEAIPHPEGYEIDITVTGVEVRAHDEAGIYYAVCTLVQILSQVQGVLPSLKISDWPDYPVRGVMLDISRDKVPTMKTLYGLVDLLSTWKVNQFQLYTEHTFAYQNHPEVWEKASPVTGKEIMALDVFCRERFIELVPNQNSFGHMHHWLEHPRYQSLAEVTGGYVTPWGEKRKGSYSLCPGDPGSLGLVVSLYDELLPHFTSRMVNVGCDETFDLGQGRSKQECEQRGTGRVYLDYLLKVYQSVQRRGYRMLFWGDIITQYPDLVPEFPRNAIALEWGYDADHPFAEHGEQFAAAGMPFYVCPGTSSWCSITGRTDNALGNLRSAAINGLKFGARGYLNTDWGDLGHWQTLPVSYLGFGMGAAYAWNLAANREADVCQAISQFAFQDASGAMGKLAYEMGNIYRQVDIVTGNGSPIFWCLQWPLDKIRTNFGTLTDNYTKPLAAIEQSMKYLDKAQMKRPDAELIKEEFQLAARMLRHGCKRGLLAGESRPVKARSLRNELGHDLEALLDEYKHVWLRRNRPGGLKDSMARLKALKRDYA